MTNKQWEKHLIVNGYDAYSMAIVFAAICVKEFGEEDGLKQVRGLSGFQAENAKKLAKEIPSNIKE